MKRIIVGALLAACSATVFSAENFTLDCGTGGKILYATGHKFRNSLVTRQNKNDVWYEDVFTTDAGNGLHYATLAKVITDNSGKLDESKNDYVYLDGAVQLVYTGEGINTQFRYLNDTGNHACKTIGYDQKLANGQ
ncbi:hypothetical protein C7266_24285 [Klebsiella variicola]|uniref:hypothetical protein n=1 Tax=Klebsiella variicola TaxID=244366 RepID=UPI001C825938|nr:hypothetical protein [Klebsiella variicola]MBX4610361.1 hypothetical protein [Klebsiella variicola]